MTKVCQKEGFIRLAGQPPGPCVHTTLVRKVVELFRQKIASPTTPADELNNALLREVVETRFEVLGNTLSLPQTIQHQEVVHVEGLANGSAYLFEELNESGVLYRAVQFD